jgi:predicted nucleic acid-binding protein
VRILIDTDVLLDVALARAEFLLASAVALRWAERHPGHAAIAWHSLSNLAYLLRPDARPFASDLLRFVHVARTGTDEAQLALHFPMADLEDALQAAAAQAFRASYIVTRNTSDFRGSPVPALSPAHFAARVADERK